MEVTYRCCCGIDVHKKVIVAFLNEGGGGELREFGTTTLFSVSGGKVFIRSLTRSMIP